MMKKLLSLTMAFLMIFGTAAFAGDAGNKDEQQVSMRNADAPSLRALIEYVEAVTDEASPDYIPPADRIATFDMEGTLSAELAPT